MQRGASLLGALSEGASAIECDAPEDMATMPKTEWKAMVDWLQPTAEHVMKPPCGQLHPLRSKPQPKARDRM